MILLIDNYDSFAYNLYQLIGTVDPDIEVVRNDTLTVEEIDAKHPDCIVLSPGPGRPEDAGVCIDVVKKLSGKYPILGVCLGHQAICAAFGATVTYARALMHGKTSIADLEDVPLFSGLERNIQVARYHSLAVDPATLPGCLRVTAMAHDGDVMAVQHTEHPTYGLQFHPESIMTPCGLQILSNFIKIAKSQEGRI